MYEHVLERVVITSIFLIVVSCLDFKIRRVPFGYFTLFGIASVISALSISFDVLLYSALILPIAFILSRSGIMGFADFLVFTFITLMSPMATLTDSTITPFTLLLNAGILAGIIPLLNIIRNLIQIKKGIDIFAGYKHMSRLNKILVMSLAYYSENPRNNIIAESYRDGLKVIDVKMKSVNEDFTDEKNVWVFPSIPFIIFITMGYFIQVLYGPLIL